MNNRQPAGFDSARRKAEALANDKTRVSSLLTEALSKADKNKVSLKKVWNDLTTLVHLIRAWVSGNYRDVPWKTIVLAIAVIVYFVNPFDVVPDFIPLIGYLDDATIVGFVISSIGGDLARFRMWKQSHS